MYTKSNALKYRNEIRTTQATHSPGLHHFVELSACIVSTYRKDLKHTLSRFGCRTPYEVPPLRLIQYLPITASPQRGTFLDERHTWMVRHSNPSRTLHSSARLSDTAHKGCIWSTSHE